MRGGKCWKRKIKIFEQRLSKTFDCSVQFLFLFGVVELKQSAERFQQREVGCDGQVTDRLGLFVLAGHGDNRPCWRRNIPI